VSGVEIELVREEQGAQAGDASEGEIVAKGKSIMIGYWNDPEATSKVLKDGRLYTGDIGRMDEGGYLYFVGRKCDRIKIDDHWVSPKEVEDVIHEMSEVHEASVVGIHNDQLGVVIRSVVVIKEGNTLDAQKVQRYCREKLAPYRYRRKFSLSIRCQNQTAGKL